MRSDRWMMSLLYRIGGIILVSGLVAGCASTPPVTADYDTSEDVTVYETKSISASNWSMGSVYGGRSNLRVHALAACNGQECTPDEVTLIFQISGTSDLQMNNRSVELSADGKEFHSESGPRGTPQHFGEIDRTMGYVGSLQLSLDEFETISEAEDLSGRLGASEFTLSYGRRSAFRALIQQAQGGSSS